MKRKVLASQLSFIVQGNVSGTKENSSLYTKRLCESIRKYFEGAEIILSTWENQKTEDLDVDVVVKSQLIDCSYIIRPDGNVYPHTLNHEIITSYAGVERATREYSVKVRSDMIFHGDILLDYLDRYCYHRDMDYKVCRERIIVLPTYNFRRGVSYPYNICDWLYAGYTEDIKNIFDIPLQDAGQLYVRKNEKIPRVEDNVGAEQYIWMSYLNKNGHVVSYSNAMRPTKDFYLDFEKTIAENLIMVDAPRLKVDIQKNPHSGYASRAMLSQGFYTFCEWKRLYNKYGGGKEIWLFNPWEDILYFIAFNVRYRIRMCSPCLYERIVKFIRKVRRRNEDGNYSS